MSQLDTMKGRTVVIFCANYIYSGVLETVSHDLLSISDAHIVYETGAFSDKAWKDAQKLPVAIHYIERSSVESLGEVVR